MIIIEDLVNIKSKKKTKGELGYNLVSLSHEFGREIHKSIQKEGIRFFKSYQLRPKTGLKKQQFNLGLRWLKKKRVY